MDAEGRDAARDAARDLAQANEVVSIVRRTVGDALIGAYLHGSAVLGGMRGTSDVDVLAVIDRPTAPHERRAIVDGLLAISGRRARRGPARPVELTLAVRSEIWPWRYPPRIEMQYGEWLRDDYVSGVVPGPEASPDAAILLAVARSHGRALRGPPLTELTDPIPPDDVRRSAVAGVPGLVADLATDTRNVLLTLARIWCTLDTGDIRTKDAAAAWAAERLPEPLRSPLTESGRMYLAGEDRDDWGDDAPTARATADTLVRNIERLTSMPAGRQAP